MSAAAGWTPLVEGALGCVLPAGLWKIHGIATPAGRVRNADFGIPRGMMRGKPAGWLAMTLLFLSLRWCFCLMVGALWAVKYSQAEIWRHHQNRVRRCDSFLSLEKEKKGGARADVLARKKILARPGPLRHGVRTGASPPEGRLSPLRRGGMAKNSCKLYKWCFTFKR